MVRLFCFWASCSRKLANRSSFQTGQVMDFYLSRGDTTKFLSNEQTVWWRKAL